MGYTTEFEGRLRIEPPLRPEHRVYLQRFSQTRRMRREPQQAERQPDPVRTAAGLPIGAEGAYFVGSDDFAESDPSVADVNRPHAPLRYSLYCGWTPSDDGSTLSWNGTEKFYEYATWLEFLIQHFLKPWQYRLNGRIDWRGDDWDDCGSIIVRDHDVTVADVGAPAADPFVDN